MLFSLVNALTVVGVSFKNGLVSYGRTTQGEVKIITVNIHASRDKSTTNADWKLITSTPNIKAVSGLGERSIYNNATKAPYVQKGGIQIEIDTMDQNFGPLKSVSVQVANQIISNV
jgi:hypothetical protein